MISKQVDHPFCSNNAILIVLDATVQLDALLQP